MLTKKDYKNFEYAKNEANKSDFHCSHTGCVVVYKNSIVGKGHNTSKTHPIQKRYNRKYRDFNPGNIIDALHAEMMALLSIDIAVSLSIDWSKVKIYVYRISPGKELGFGLARPCPACMAALKDFGVQNIYYTTDDGYAYEKIK